MTSILILLLLIFGMLVLRQTIIVILAVSLAYLHIVYGDGDVLYIIEDSWIAIDKEALLSIPMFILCGSVMTRGAIAERLIAIMVALSSPFPGGLGAAAILSCAVFAAISGSSPVTLLAVGAIMYPALMQEGYPKRFSLGALTSGGTLGIVIPPSIPMIIYGISTETSIVDLFLAGIIPGILLSGVMVVYSMWVNRDQEVRRKSLAEVIEAFRHGIWALLMPILLLGGIYSGYFTPTESAAIALIYAMLVEVFIHRELKFKDFYHIVQQTLVMLGSLVPIIAIAVSLNLLLTAEGVPNMLVNWLQANVSSVVMFILGVNILLLVVGCFMDTLSALLILAPILLPIARSYGIDPVHFGIIMVINLEIGLLTPPMGLNLIVANSAFKEKFSEITRAVIPFIGLMIMVLMLVSFIPSISLFFVN